MGAGVLNWLYWLDTFSGWLLAAGLLLVLVVNLRLWRRDQRAAKRLQAATQPAPVFAHTPRVSFLVPAWNEAEYLPASIEAILNLRYPDKELVLCVGGSDGSLHIARGYECPGVIVLEQQPGEGKQGALRRCFECSSGEILFLTDGDCIVDDACVEATLRPILLENEQVCTGFWKPFSFLQERPFIAYQWANHLRYQAEMDPWQAATLDGRNSALRREALEAAGGFLNPAAIGTDYVLSQRLLQAGYTIRAVLGSRSQTEYPSDIRSYLRQGSRWYRNRLVQGFKYRRWPDVVKSLWGAGASLFVMTGALLFLLPWRFPVFIWSTGLFHLFLSQVRLVRFSQLSGQKIHRFSYRLGQFIAYTLVSDYSMIKGLLESLNWRDRRIW